MRPLSTCGRAAFIAPLCPRTRWESSGLRTCCSPYGPAIFIAPLFPMGLLFCSTLGISATLADLGPWQPQILNNNLFPSSAILWDPFGMAPWLISRAWGRMLDTWHSAPGTLTFSSLSATYSWLILESAGTWDRVAKLVVINKRNSGKTFDWNSDSPCHFLSVMFQRKAPEGAMADVRPQLPSNGREY